MPRKNGRHQPPKAPCTPDIRIRRRFRRASVGRPMIAVLVLGISAAMPAMAAARNVSDYDALIQRARAGDHKAALDIPSAPVAANRAARRAGKDRIAFAGWAGRQPEGLNAHPALPRHAADSRAKTS